ncbi:MAG: hypothetical protein GY852_08870 [bacterium]|nr:hypothetical protein [bacterium]
MTTRRRGGRSSKRTLNQKRVDQLVRRVEVAREETFEGRHEVGLLEPHVKKPFTQIGLRIDADSPHYAEKLEDVLAATIVEHECHVAGEMDELTLLRSVNITGAGGMQDHFAMDRLRTHLPEFPNISSIGINSKSLRATFSFFFDQDNVKGDLKSAGFRVTEDKDGKGRRILVATAKDGGHFSVGDTFVSLDLARKTKRFDECFTRFVEFIATTQFKSNWSKENEIVYLNKEVRPILEVMLGKDYPKNVVGGVMNSIFKMMEREDDLEATGDFRETRKSQIARAKNLQGDGERTLRVIGSEGLEHIDYIVVKEGEDPVAIVQFDCEVDVRALDDGIGKSRDKKRLFLTNPEEKRESRVSFVNKGRGRAAEVRRWAKTVEESRVLNEEGCTVLKFKNADGKSTFIVPLAPKTLWESLKALDMVYDERMFYTTTGRSREIRQSALTPLEREISVAFRNLTRMYHFFLEIEDAKRAFEVSMETGVSIEVPTAQKWVIAKMLEAGEDVQFHERVLHVLDIMHDRIDPNNLRVYGGTKESQEKARDFYAILQQLKGRFEAMVELY